MNDHYSLVPGTLSAGALRRLLTTEATVTLDPACLPKIQASRRIVLDIVESHRTVYGINTGFGLLASTRISEADLVGLQRNLLLSHAAGTGEPLPDEIVRLILLLKINSLARGFSGVRPVILDILLALYNAGIYPLIPAKGSVGASGDLAPLAHLCLPLIGEGSARYRDDTLSGREALALAGVSPIKLAAKEGLALINGTQVSTAIALYYLFEAQRLLSAAVVIGALSVDAALGSDVPFDENIHLVRNQPGQVEVAALLRSLLAGSMIRASHADCERVQDPYSLRCQPQVLGACLDNLRHAGEVLLREANAVSDNPLIFKETDTILSGGNFHAEPVAQAADLLAIVLAETGALAERRVALLIDPHFNGGLPAFLIQHGGLHSGFMIAHVTAAALASANKSLAHPASVDSLPTSANQEDHVSMATGAALRLREMVENVEGILAVELLAAAQGVDLRRPLQTSPDLHSILQNLRDTVPFLEEDRQLSLDIEAARKYVRQIGLEYAPVFFEDEG